MSFNNFIIADDHPLFREGLELSLKKLIPSASIFIASNGEEVLEILSNTPIDLIFLDIRMPGKDGIETTMCIRKFDPNVKIVAVTMLNDKATVLQMFNAGANGFIHKNIDKTVLQHVIAAMANNELFLSEEVGDYKSDISTDGNNKNFLNILSERERQILMLICNQYSTKEIAHKLHLTEKTVETHRNHLMMKTKSKNVVGLTMFAIENGYFFPEHIRRK